MSYTRYKRPIFVSGKHNPKLLEASRKQEIKRHPIVSKNNCVPYDSNAHLALCFLMLVGGAYAAYQFNIISQLKTTIHGEPVTRLTSQINCTKKTEGISKGKICEVEQKTYFLKSISHDAYCFEEYNRQFVAKNIQGRVPKTLFFQEKTYLGVNFFIGAEKVPDLQFINADVFYYEDLCQKLRKQGVAKLAVASTFIKDLRNQNWGYNKNGLIFIDVDSINTIPCNTIEAYLNIAFNGINAPFWGHYGLSLDDLKDMINIYKNMLKKPLPPFHEHFNLDNQVYSDTLTIFIDICQNILNDMKKDLPKNLLKSNQSSYLIKDKLVSGIRERWSIEARKLTDNKKQLCSI